MTIVYKRGYFKEVDENGKTIRKFKEEPQKQEVLDLYEDTEFGDE